MVVNESFGFYDYGEIGDCVLGSLILGWDKGFEVKWFTARVQWMTQRNQAQIFLQDQIAELTDAIKDTWVEAAKYGSLDAVKKLESLFPSVIEIRQDFQVYQMALSSMPDECSPGELKEIVESLRNSHRQVHRAERKKLTEEMRKTVKGTTGVGGEDDDDVEVQSGKVGLRCPITGKFPDHPVVSSVCGHVYERDAIMECLRGRKGTACPVVGCSKILKAANIVEDAKITEAVQRAKLEADNVEYERLDDAAPKPSV